MVYVVVFAVLVFLTSFVLVAALAWRTFKRVMSLKDAVASASTRIAEASAALDELQANRK